MNAQCKAPGLALPPAAFAATGTAATTVTKITSCTPAALEQAAAKGGSYLFTCSRAIELTSQLVVSSGTLELNGAKHEVTISGQRKTRIFDVTGGSVVLRHLTLTKGQVKEEKGKNGKAGTPGANGKGVTAALPTGNGANGQAGTDGSDGASGGTGKDGRNAQGGAMYIAAGATVTLYTVTVKTSRAIGGNRGNGGRERRRWERRRRRQRRRVRT